MPKQKKNNAALLAEKAQGADPEDPDEYRAQSIFWVPPEARWPHLKAQARQSTIGQLVDDAMAGIERDNPARPYYERMIKCARESRTLATVRDALLPKLISGNLRVRDTELFAEVTT